MTTSYTSFNYRLAPSVKWSMSLKIHNVGESVSFLNVQVNLYKFYTMGKDIGSASSYMDVNLAKLKLWTHFMVVQYQMRSKSRSTLNSSIFSIISRFLNAYDLNKKLLCYLINFFCLFHLTPYIPAPVLFSTSV